MVRHDISHQGVHRLLKDSTSAKRVGEKAVEQSVHSLEQMLGRLARQLEKDLMAAKAKTLTDARVESACETIGLPRSVCQAESDYSSRKDRSELSGPGLLRVMKKRGLDDKARSGKDATAKLVGVAEAYVEHLGKSGGRVTKAAGRKTLMGKDIRACSC